MGRLSTDNRLIAERDLLAGVADTSEARILVVDDDDSVRVILRNLLIKLGFTCETARDGMEALDRLKADAYDIVLADIRMPVMDGMTMLEKIKSIHPDTDVIMMTGYGFAYTFMDVLEKGATDFITKPVNHLELKARINRILRERQLKAALYELAITDNLTSLFNRRHLYQVLRQEIQRARRQKHGLSFLILDVDGFKECNDTFGHLQGDQILVSLGQILLSNIRQNVDSAYRLGGDEFAIILVETGQLQAGLIADRIRLSFKAKVHNKCTLSIGVAQLSPADDVDEFIRRSDESMYRAKESGGDQVAFFQAGL
jgi:two-component system cell cycle response regulator